MGFTGILRLTGCLHSFISFLSYLHNFILFRMMTNKILTHLCLATAQDLPGRINSPALERLKMLSRGLDQKHTEEFERKVVMKHGDLRAQSVSRNFEEDCRMRVNKLWWDVRVRGNFGFHRTDMSRRVVPRQGLIRTLSLMTSSWEKDVLATNKEQVFCNKLGPTFLSSSGPGPGQVRVRWGSGRQD